MLLSKPRRWLRKHNHHPQTPISFIHYQCLTRALITVSQLHRRHINLTPKSKPQPHYTGNTMSFWYKHVACPQGCGVAVLRDQRFDEHLVVHDDFIYLHDAEYCQHNANKGIFKFKTDLGVSVFALCV
jgi:hypothetical protein